MSSWCRPMHACMLQPMLLCVPLLSCGSCVKAPCTAPLPAFGYLLLLHPAPVPSLRMPRLLVPCGDFCAGAGTQQEQQQQVSHAWSQGIVCRTPAWPFYASEAAIGHFAAAAAAAAAHSVMASLPL